MNFWCYPPEFMDVLREGFPHFLESMKDPLKDISILWIIKTDIHEDIDKIFL